MSNLRQRPSSSHRPHESTIEPTTYNIIPVHNLLIDHPSLRFPEVRAATAALRPVGDLRQPPFIPWQPHYDLLDWLAAFFGFQNVNVSNQREHIVLHLANAQMRLQPPPDNIDTLDPAVLQKFRRKLLSNYTRWCAFLGRKSNIWIFDSRRQDSASEHRLELLYVSLYLLIWGESANLRFIPGCICYIFHHMAMEMNRILEGYLDENTGRPVLPAISGENAFLNRVVKPIYDAVKAEVENSRNGTAPHLNWRNYDDINEYFWSRRCFDKLKWPIDIASNFFATTSRGKRVGKTGFVQQLRLRFQFFGSAMQFNLMPAEQLLTTRGTIKSKFNDALNRFKLRYGLATPFKKLESNQVEVHKFALIWNEIIVTFREEDIVSDHEVEFLELPQNTWNVRVVSWPCFLLSNELLLALSQAKELVDAPDKWLWYKIGKNEYRRCAVIETYDSVRHLLLTIVRYNTQEHSIITTLFQEIDNSINTEKFTKMFNMYALPNIHSKLISLVGLLIKPEKDVNRVVNTLQALYEVVTRDFFKQKRSMDELIEDGLAPHGPLSGIGLLFENAIELPYSEDMNFYRQARRLHTVLTSRDSMNNIPVNLEARRRIAFVSNSLFMNMPHVPQVEKMMAFSVLTPYYNEEVIYRKEQLKSKTEDGVTTLYNLQSIYADEWDNFLERMKREGMVSEEELWTYRLRDLRLWASYRGQTLARTVRGMMYYYRALNMLAFLDSASEVDIREGAQELVSMGSFGISFNSEGRTTTAAGSTMFKGHEYGTVLMKCTYVVACQIYGTQKAEKKPQAEEILYLMKKNQALRVAYVDEVPIRDGIKEYYSVLVKYDQELYREVEIYRVKLPGPLKLGEGKPENQNHALIFTRGDAVQTIDMNQDIYFEEALKMFYRTLSS